MERSTIIASVIAGAGILIAGSVAGTAAVNAAASSEPDPSNVQLLAAPAALEPSAPASTASATGAALLPFTTQPLPAIASAPGSSAMAPASTSPSSQAPSTAPTTTTLPTEQAVALVLAATGGGSTLDVRQASRAGYDAWAVTVQRPDGSVVTGFVDRATATVFDWRVVQEAPASLTAAYEEDEYEEEDEEYESEHESDEHESDEHEGDEDDD